MFSYYNRLALTWIKAGRRRNFLASTQQRKGWGGDFQTICTLMFPQRSTNKMFTQSDNPIVPPSSDALAP